MAEKGGRSFGLIQPTLIQQLKKILDEYPDDGQILKELIQNAEDARATQVKFLHDRHSHETSNLYDDELAEFQGPALYAYNNARFTTQDWTGIQLLSDSIKLEDPMKVGRFGLGFKSVFHITDLPSLLSDCQIGFIDPHGIHFSDKRCQRTGKLWHLQDDFEAMDQVSGQFSPYKGIFDCTDEVFSRGFYDGTLFRFPLRRTPSELSETVYSPDKVETLFESFKADAHLMLLFLQHLEEIELYVRDELEPIPRKVFQVKIAEKSLQTVRAKRKEFRQKIVPGKVLPSSVAVTYPITIEIVNFDSPGPRNTVQHSFLVTSYLCGGEISLTFQNLISDKVLSYLPSVGVAMHLPTGPRLQTPDVQGHVFCSLPLPVQKTSLTGLPVHVNGFFALSQNRRYIKSPNADQEDQRKTGGRLTDKSLLWNKCLLEEAIPRAYATMILEAIRENSAVIVPRTAIYKAWPDVKKITQNWDRITKPLLEILLKKEIVFTKVGGGTWLTVKQAFFDLLPESETKHLLQRVMLAANLPVVSVPTHITEAIAGYLSFTEITAPLTREVLKMSPSCYKKLERGEKILLLQFCLTDCKFDALHGLELLPLSSGTFTTFSNQADATYISSPEHPKELLPGLSHRFLDEEVDADIFQKLKAAAKQECTQLRILCKGDVPALLRQALPSQWSQGETVLWYPNDKNQNHPPENWIRLVWGYLRENFHTAKDIQRFSNLPLIPVSQAQTPVTLTQLCYPSRVILKCLFGDAIDDRLTNVLKKLGLIVLTDCPTFVTHHPSVIGIFVHPPSAAGVVKALEVSSSKMAGGMFPKIVRKRFSTDEKRLLRSFLARVRQGELKKEESIVLQSLPIFETLSEKFVSKNDGLCAAPLRPLPISASQDLIDISQKDSRALAILLQVRILEPTELLCEMIFPDIHKGKFSGEQIDKLIPYVFKHFDDVIRLDATFKRTMKELPFVPTQKRRVTPSQVFDPRNEILRKIFVHEDVFPTGKLYNDPAALVMLEELGIKKEDGITAKDVLESARLVASSLQPPSKSQKQFYSSLQPSTAKHKSKAILQYLNNNPRKLLETINKRHLGSLLRDICWVSRLQERTPHFPPTLPWWNIVQAGKERFFFKPTEVKSHHYASLIGTVSPVVDADPSSEVFKYFGWGKKPDVTTVVGHLRNVITFYSKEEKPYYIFVVDKIYSFLVGESDDTIKQAFQGAEISGWVWNGDGFSSPEHVLSCKPSIDLTPYIRPLPSEMKNHCRLFSRFGMKSESDASVLLQVLSMMKEKYDFDSFKPGSLEVKHDLQLSVDILNEMASANLSQDLKMKVLLPTHVKGNTCVRLEPAERCMYCEHDEWLNREDSLDMEYSYVHPNIPNNTARLLGVPSQTHRMLSPTFLGEEFGQEEKLTTRLNRLLEDYTDGFAVLKELIQNADDAGATEVKFFYDERTNDDALTCLIDENMRGCQGPALWVYNDATFTDEDFVNITRLNEATKVHDTEKIGRFGLGFNAVYNLTDVPMFVSRNYFVIFDPHTTYLGNVIGNTRKPGIRIDLNKDAKRLQSFKNQFKPFNGIFGCDLHLKAKDNSFDGTLFRFPLRTGEQAARSEIKKLFYNDQEIRQLLQMFLDRAKSLLLFTQNVLHLEVYRTSESSREGLPPELMFQVTKSMSEGGIMRELSVPVTLPATAMKLDTEKQTLLTQTNFLQASSMAAKKARSHSVELFKFPESSIAVNVHCSVTESGLKFFKRHQRFREECDTWLVVSSMGNGQALQFSKNDPSLLPSAGVAVQLEPKESGIFMPLPVVEDVEGFYPNGTIFCYLPLPIRSGLPVHINGPFAVTSNRRHLQKKLEDDKTCYGVKWNNALLHDAVVSAFLKLLEDVKQIIPGDGSYAYHTLWPRACSVCQDCWSFLASFYRQITSGGHPLFSDGLKWADISQVVFLDPSLRENSEIGNVSFAVLQQLMIGVNNVVIDLPAEVFQSILQCRLGDRIKGKTFNETRFFHDLLFPNISKISANVRDELVLYALKSNNKDFDELIKNHACIPASPNGNELKCPSQLVNPNKEASVLFCRDDGMFPFGTESTFLNPQVLTKLEVLGMKSSDLPWQDILERAESVQRLNTLNSKAATKRAKVLLDFVEKKLKRKGKAPTDRVLTRLLEVQFLPVLQKPEFFPLPWKGEEFRSGKSLLVAPQNVYLKEKMHLVCCTEPLVGVDVPKRVRKLLRLEDKDVTAEQVLKQLEGAVSANIDTLDRNGFEEVARVCTEAYLYLQDNMDSLLPTAEQFLLERKFILVEKDKLFVPAARVAFEVSTDCSPYLFKLPEDFSDRFPNLMNFSGVRKQFEEADYVSSLFEIKQQFNQNHLDDTTLQVAVNMANQLADVLGRAFVDSSEVRSKFGCVYLPDSKKVMRDVAELCFKECPWMPDDPDEIFVHEKIPWSICEQLAVKTRRDEALQQHDIGFPFGQKEKLTNRLKRILTGYQGEKEILKELLQNADDAQATKIYFIKDPRHHPDKRVFKDTWKPLQGPALCVYNNKPFTNADIEGICNLGEGSKGDDPNKTGQYGVGFNAVYQLTDVPSFISKSEEIGDVLCVFDPHCKYIPHSSEARPGRMFKDVDLLRQKFPDVFPCYLEKHFPVQNATMFRFPLKSEEMARESQICRTSVTVEKLDEMMEDLKKELFEVLLFVNNVKKIGIAAVDESGQLINNYSVQVVMSQDDARKREEFSCYVKEIGKQVKEKRILPINVKFKRRTYTLQLKDNHGMSEKWLIVQQVGFEKPVPESVLHAFQGHQLGMLPRGGVACLLDSTSQFQRENRAYCFLPLPLRTNLPVHINGHFALDHETRRNLWRGEVGGYQSDWNSALLSDVIASCYLTLLDEVREFIQLPVGQDSACSALRCSKTMMLRRIRSYERLFPGYPTSDPYWKTLVDAVYQEMDRKKMRLIPLVRSEQADRPGRPKKLQQPESVKLSWFPTTGTGSDQTYFNNLEIKGYFAPLPPKRDEKEEDRKRREESRIKRKAAFEEILLETGFNLVAFSLNVFHSLKEAAVEVHCVSPAVVMDFYKSFSDDDSLCSIGAVPCRVNKTPFEDTEGVVRMLKYCKDDEHFLESLPGLPLLLTQDNCLHPFSETQPRCLSLFADILPRSGPLFVHSRVRIEVFSDVNPRNVSVFCPLDVKTFASQLHLTLPPCYHSEDHYVKWYPEDKCVSLPSLRWIQRVWDFLQDFARTTTKDVKEESMAAFIHDLFSPLSNWSLLPSTETSSLCDKQPRVTHLLVPLKKAEAVLDFKDCGTSGQKLVDALKLLGLPELNTVALTTQTIGSVSYSKRDSYELARNLVATVSSPHSLLFALNQKLEWDPSSLDNKLKLTDAIVVLDYFSHNIEDLTDADREILRKLPFYPSVNGVLHNLQEKKAFVIPYEIPAKEMYVVESQLGCLLLRSRQQLSDLFKFLPLESASHVEVYMNFVLRCFQCLSHDGRLTHLRFIRDYISLSGGSENEHETTEKKRLFEYLKGVKLIPSIDGTLKTVSSYHDPHNDVFVAMLPQDSFPPEAFNSEEWLPFLRKIGLVQDVSHDQFLMFAEQVEREAETARTDDTYRKSQVLVYHLISRPNAVGEGLLQIVRDVAFVAADPVDEQLQTICPPFGGRTKGKVPFIAFSGAVVKEHEKIAWTETHLLPRWADPRFQKFNLGCPHRKFDQYLNSFLSQLNILTKPSVDLVVRHCQTICYHLGGKESEKENTSSEYLSTVMEVMQSIYSFLENNAKKDTQAKRQLQKTPCILVEKGTKLIFPRQAILELYNHLEIKPFLYRVPPEFGMFHPLFEFLGCSKSATPIHYAMVLEMLQKNSQGETLHPNEVRACSRAVEGFVDSLQEKSADVSTLSTLYLPATPSRDRVQNSAINTIPVSLQESQKLIFDDAPTYGNRIQGLDQPFVLDLKLMGVRCKSADVNYEDVLIKLPKPLQPTMLSLVVKEKLTDPENTVTVTTGVVNAMKQQLSSVHFGLGIVRIIRDTNSREGDVSKGVAMDILESLRTIKLFAVENLRTTLLYNGVLIPESERKVPYFKEKLELSEKHIWKVYVNAANTTDDKISLSTLLAKVIVEIYGRHLGRNGFVIPEMLLCAPAMIQSLLDRYSIRKDDSCNAVEMTIYPEPGTLIPIEDHHLLDDAFEQFEPEDYVGFQLHDPTLDLMEGTATYIYAIIIEEVTDGDVSILTKTYRINIGNDKEPVEVKATKLFKFCRLKSIFDEHSGCHRSKEEVFEEIAKVLKQAWEPHVPEEERRQILKRLCMRWHPKKNVGNEEFYRSVYQHIVSEVTRLGGSYDDFFDFLGERAREHESQRKEYRRNFRGRYGAWESSSSQRSGHDFPPSLCNRNPQPEEAKRWLRQAKADLKAGSAEVSFSTSSCEWMCFKFHQAAEKALKAARYCKHVDKTNVHNLVDNCYGLEDPELVESARELENLVGDSTRMRYPDRMSYPQIPNDVYSQDMALKAREIAEKIVGRVDRKLP